MKKNIVLTVLKKELLDLFRDKKTMILGVLIPILIIPVMYGILGTVMSNEEKSATENIKIALVDKGNSSLGQFLKSEKTIKITPSSNIKNDVKDGKITLGIEIPENFDKTIESGSNTNVTITYDNTSSKSNMSFSTVKNLIQGYSQQVVSHRLEIKNIDISILTPVAIQEVTSAKESEAMGKYLLGMLLPFMITMYSIMGPLAAATDLGAGEKERGTLEPLLTTEASRISLLWGKFLAITVMGLLTIGAFIIGFIVAVMEKNSILGELSSAGAVIDVKAVAIICLACLLTTMVFGALELSVSIYAKSFKEAQTYISPIYILGMIPGFLVYMADVKSLNPLYFHIPVANVMCVMKEAIAGIYNTSHMLIVFGWSVIYVVLAICWAVYMFSREEVIFRT